MSRVLVKSTDEFINDIVWSRVGPKTIERCQSYL